MPGGDLRTDAFARQNRLASAAGVTELRRYLPGLAQQSVATGAAEYFLGDQIGTTRFLTDDDQSPPVAATNRRVYTAFGELVEITGTGQTRYGYAGAWGYQEHDADGVGGPDNILGSPPTGPAIGEVFPFLHVGWRYYDPSTGRFLQRDPIGIVGGFNVYGYVDGNSATAVDPLGHAPIGFPYFGPPPREPVEVVPVGEPKGPYPVPPGSRVHIKVKIYDPPAPWWKRAAGAVGRGARAVGGALGKVGGAIGNFFRPISCCPFFIDNPGLHYFDNYNKGVSLNEVTQFPWTEVWDEDGNLIEVY